MTYKQKFNKKYGFKENTPHSLKDISKITGYSLKGLRIIFSKGKGAYKSNPQSVRPMVKSPEQWAYARVYSAVMGGKAQKIDKLHLNKKSKSSKMKMNSFFKAKEKARKSGKKSFSYNGKTYVAKKTKTGMVVYKKQR